MKTFIRTIIALFAICTFASCANDDLTTEITTEKEEVSINLIVSLGQEQTTRAAVSDAEDAVGNEYNINIDAKDIQLLLYKGDGSYFTKATVTTIRKVESEHNKYIIEGKFFSFSKDDLKKSYKLVVTANTSTGNCKLTTTWQTRGNETDDYKTLRYDYSNGETFTRNIINSANEGIIPMWGNKAIILDDGGRYEVKLLRAMAKVTVCLEKDLTNVDIESVKLTNCKNAGMLTPKRASTFSETQDITSENNGTEELNVPNDAEFTNTEMQFIPYEKNGYKYYCLYIPEQEAGKDSKILVTINGKEYTLYFANYGSNNDSSNPGDLYPVLRNNWYNFVIKSVSTDAVDLNLKYYVADWNEKTATDITFD